MNREKFLSLREVGKKLGVSAETIRKWIARGLPHYRGPEERSKILLKWDEVLEWLRQNAERHQRDGDEE